jgi:hypothetical protein
VDAASEHDGGMNRYPQTLRLLPVAALAAILAAPVSTPAQEKPAPISEAELFGDIFVHPRDRFYMPGQAPSRAILESETIVKDGRGQVNRYEYSRGNSFIARETWRDERGESQGRIGVGRKF